MEKFRPAVYSKYRTKAKLLQLLAESPKDPGVDLTNSNSGPYGTPKEILQYLGEGLISIECTDGTVLICYDDETKSWVVV